MSGTLIKNGRVIDTANQFDEVTDLYIDRGKIVGIGKPPAEFVLKKTLDASNRWVI
ncbi:MAG: dihydroorotase, partial [Gammaproteobacteria bacterium]